jgi:hypothetical protein
VGEITPPKIHAGWILIGSRQDFGPGEAMKRHRRAASLAIAVVVASCGGGKREEPLSDGLKVFVTARAHVADFAHDPLLAGSTAIEKADTFCNSDPNTPPVGTYKALLVDGVLRDARSLTNWVLLPSTKYYRVGGNVEIGTTTAGAIFGSYWEPLTHSVLPSGPGNEYPWTGIGDPADFTAGPDCTHWSSTESGTGAVANPRGQDGSAFGGNYITVYCYSQMTEPLLCVEQP